MVHIITKQVFLCCEGVGDGDRPRGKSRDGGPGERDAYGDGGPEGEISSSKKGKLLERKGCVCEGRVFNNGFTMYCSQRF